MSVLRRQRSFYLAVLFDNGSTASHVTWYWFDLARYLPRRHHDREMQEAAVPSTRHDRPFDSHVAALT